MSNNNLILACWATAEELLKYGHVVDCIRCLEGLCIKVNFDRQPILEVKTRIRLAIILLKYTENFNHAKVHLEKAVRYYYYQY
jgi:MAternally-affected-uncoordination protein